jgi:hypothetical protein
MGPSFFRQSNPKIGAWIVWLLRNVIDCTRPTPH